MTGREHDVSSLTAAELERARRELSASLALARPAHPSPCPSRRTWTRLTPSWPSAAGSYDPAVLVRLRHQ